MPMVERYIWSVTYRDGTEVQEYPDPDTHRSFRDLRDEDVAMLVVGPNHHLGVEGPSYRVLCDEGMIPVMYRSVAVNATTGESARWHVLGTKRGAVTSLIYLPNDGGDVVLTDRPLQIGVE